ncbi:MAG TPA: tetratricopeptide repeat protein [Pirellulales bacterium]|nr:tetratricopeptide repeat protein [Pirellulales bacterium]
MRSFTVARFCLAATLSTVFATLASAQQSSPATGPGNASGAASADAKPAISAADQKIKAAYEKTNSASTLDDFSQIISLCQDGLSEGSTGESAAYARQLEAWAYNRRGEKYSEGNNEKQALKDFEAALALNDKLWKAVQNRGVSRAYLGDTKGALADFDSVIQLNPNYANAWFNRGELKYAQGDVNGALADYDHAIQLQPGDAGFYNSRGHANYRLGNFREALADYNRAVQINPDDALALVNRGDAYREQGIYGAAASDYRDAVRTDSKLGRAYLSTAWLMATCPDPRYRDADKAIAAAQRAIELDGDKDYRYLDTLAAAQASAGKFDDAKTSVHKALNEAPKNEAAHIQQRLDLYESARAYREGAPAEAVKPASANLRAP